MDLDQRLERGELRCELCEEAGGVAEGEELEGEGLDFGWEVGDGEGGGEEGGVVVEGDVAGEGQGM